ncbi:MAG TPA: hypothetical protein VFE50_11715 [Cyclobacteriaceae bacterium]|nr:hypothetical protein [Cyclobacteriaceae bacterium]
MANNIRGAVVIIIIILVIVALWRGGGVIGWGILFGAFLAVTMIWTFLRGFLGNSERLENNGVILYVPAPVDGLTMGVVAPLVSGLVFYYLLHFTRPTVPDFASAIVVILLLSVTPSLWTIYSTIRDRNDFLKLSEGVIHYRNDTHEVTMSTTRIYHVKKINKGIVIFFNDNTTHIIPTQEMDFEDGLLKRVEEDVTKLIPKNEQPAMPGDVPASRPAPRTVSERAPEPQVGDATVIPHKKKVSTTSNVIGGIICLAIFIGFIWLCFNIEVLLPSPAEAGQSITDDLVLRAAFEKNGTIFFLCLIAIGFVAYVISTRRKAQVKRTQLIPS